MTVLDQDARYWGAESLGLTGEERFAFLDLMGRLARGEIPHDTSDFSGEPLTDRGPPPARITAWNMGVTHCGTAGCIQGWIRSQYGLDVDVMDPRFDDLFIPYGTSEVEEESLPCHPMIDQLGDRSMGSLTPAEGARALHHFLQGHPRDPWKRALADPSDVPLV